MIFNFSPCWFKTQAPHSTVLVKAAGRGPCRSFPSGLTSPCGERSCTGAFCSPGTETVMADPLSVNGLTGSSLSLDRFIFFHWRAHQRFDLLKVQWLVAGFRKDPECGLDVLLISVLSRLIVW